MYDNRIKKMVNMKEKALVGVLMLETSFNRIPGDIGNPSTFRFPVEYKIVKGALPKRLVIDADPDLIPLFAKAAKKLEEQGIKAITTSCGFMSIFQEELRNAVDIPFFTSSLIQVPMVDKMLGRDKIVGIICCNSKTLTKRHLTAVGITDEMEVAIIGMNEGRYFVKVFLEQSLELEREKLEKEVIEIGKKIVSQNPRVGAVVVEDTNLPPYAKALQEAIGIPVFDVVTLINMVHEALERKSYC